MINTIIILYLLTGVIISSIGCAHVIKNIIPYEKQNSKLNVNLRLFITYIIMTFFWPIVLIIGIKNS